jgi:hypothetical protein
VYALLQVEQHAPQYPLQNSSLDPYPQQGSLNLQNDLFLNPPSPGTCTLVAMAARRKSGIPAPGFMLGPTCEVQVEHKADTPDEPQEQSVKDEPNDDDDAHSEASSDVSGSTSHASSFNLSGFKLLPMRCACCKAPFLHSEDSTALTYACPCCTQDFCSLCSSYRVRLQGSGFQGTRRVCKACAEAAVAPVGETGELTGMAGIPVLTNAQQIQLQARALRTAQEAHRSALEESTSACDDSTASADGAACIAAAAERAGLGSYSQDGAEVLLMRQRQQHMLARKEARKQSKRLALAAAAAARGSSSSAIGVLSKRASATPGVTPASTANSSFASLFADNGLSNGLSNGSGNGLPLTPVPASPSSAPNSHSRGGSNGRRKLRLHEQESDNSGDANDEHTGSSSGVHNCNKKLCNSCNNNGTAAAAVPHTTTAQQVVLKGIQLAFFGCVAGGALYLLFGDTSTATHMSRALDGQSYLPDIRNSIFSSGGVHRELHDVQSRAAAAATTGTDATDTGTEADAVDEEDYGSDDDSSGADSDTEQETDQQNDDEHQQDDQSDDNAVDDDRLSEAAAAALALQQQQAQQQQAQQSDNTVFETEPDTEPDTELRTEPESKSDLPVDDKLQCVEPGNSVESDDTDDHSNSQKESTQAEVDTSVSGNGITDPGTVDVIDDTVEAKSSSNSVDSSSSDDVKVSEEQCTDDSTGVTDDSDGTVDTNNNNDELQTIDITDENEPAVITDDKTAIVTAIDATEEEVGSVDDATVDEKQTAVDGTADTTDTSTNKDTLDSTDVITTATIVQTDQQQQQQQEVDTSIGEVIGNTTDATDKQKTATDEITLPQQQQQQQQAEPLYMQLPFELKVGESILVSQALWNECSRDTTAAAIATADTTSTTSQQQLKCAPHYLVLHTSGDLALYRGLLNAVSSSTSGSISTVTDTDTTAQHKRVWHVQASKNREGGAAGSKWWSYVTRRKLDVCEHCILQLLPTGVLQLSEGGRELWVSHKPKKQQKQRSKSSVDDSSSSSSSGDSGESFAAAISADGAFAVKDINTDKTVWSVNNKRRFFGLLKA